MAHRCAGPNICCHQISQSQTALDPVSVSSDEDDDVAAFASNASVEPDDTAAAAPVIEADVKAGVPSRLGV